MRTLWPLALAAAIPASLVACKSDSPPPQHLDVTVSWNDTRQNIEGFGASSAFFGQTITEDVADQLFDAKKGIGLSLLRIMIGVPADTDNSALAAEPETGANPVATSPELYTAQQAYVRGARVWATAWTPPPIWKEHNSKLGSQTDSTVGTVFKTNKLVSSHYGDYANYLADFVDLMAKNSVPLMGVSPANEPDYVASWDGAQWSPDELTTFIGQNMGPTFAKCCASVKIITPDTASWPNVDSYVTPLLADSAAKNYLSVVATHPYQNGSAAIDLNYSKPRDNGKEFWETEWSQENSKGDTPDPTMKSAIDLMNHLHDHLTGANMNAWSWWAAYITANDLRNGDKPKIRQNPALIQPIHPDTDDPPVMFKRGYAFAHWSKFVRPGFLRLGATDHPNPGVLVEAYRDSDSHIALTAINTSGSKVTQKFLR